MAIEIARIAQTAVIAGIRPIATLVMGAGIALTAGTVLTVEIALDWWV